MKKRIAVIGAGISGLTLAQALSDIAEVCVFEKARGVGGRMSTRHAGPFHFDHGAQYFTARTPEFQIFLKPYLTAGVVIEWKGKIIAFEAGKKPNKSLWFEPHYVCAPNMNSLCKKMAEGQKVALNTEAASLQAENAGGWQLADKTGNTLGRFDWVISTAPPAQTHNLFASHIPAVSSFSQAKMQGCYALMIGFNKPWDKRWIAANVRFNPLQWIAVNSSKPGRDNAFTCLVAHSSNSWAEGHIDDDVNTAQAFLIQEFESITGIDCGNADHVSTHRWRYATVTQNDDSGPYFDETLALASTGDWSKASRIEDVWIAANKLAQTLRTHLE